MDHKPKKELSDNDMSLSFKDIKRERILIAAVDEFVTHGMANSLMKNIAEKSGVSRRTLYRYFPTKKELALAVEFFIFEKFRSILYEFAEDIDGTGYERLNKLLMFFISVIEDYKNEIRFTGEFDHYFTREYNDKDFFDKFTKLLKEIEQTFKNFFIQGIEDGSLRKDINVDLCYQTIANSFLSLAQRIVIRGDRLKAEQNLEPEDLLNQYVEIVLLGIRNK